MIKITHKKGYFKHVYTDEKGMVLTSWKEDMPIDEFNFSEALYVPEKWEDEKIFNDYREIELERAQELEELQRVEAEKKEKERQEELRNNMR